MQSFQIDACTNLPAHLIFIIGTNAASVVEERAGERRRLTAVGTVTAHLQSRLAVQQTVRVAGGRGQVGTVCQRPY